MAEAAGQPTGRTDFATAWQRCCKRRESHIISEESSPVIKSGLLSSGFQLDAILPYYTKAEFYVSSNSYLDIIMFVIVIVGRSVD